MLARIAASRSCQLLGPLPEPVRPARESQKVDILNRGELMAGPWRPVHRNEAGRAPVMAVLYGGRQLSGPLLDHVAGWVCLPLSLAGL